MFFLFYYFTYFFHVSFSGVIMTHMFEESNNYTETQDYLRPLHPYPSSCLFSGSEKKTVFPLPMTDPWNKRYIYLHVWLIFMI